MLILLGNTNKVCLTAEFFTGLFQNVGERERKSIRILENSD